MALSDAEIGTAITALIGGLAALGRWAVRLWATVRRETIEADDKRAARQREYDLEGRQALNASNERMTQALIAQATSSTTLAGEIKTLREQLDRIEWRELTPVGDAVPRRPTTSDDSRGYRPPGKPGR